MTFWDNPQMVINHIRHSCVNSDDTGMCEMVIVQDEPSIFNGKQRKKLVGYHHEDSTDYPEYSQTFDIAVSPGVMGQTPKSSRYDKTRRSKQEHHCKNIHWKENKVLSEEDRADLFQEKSVSEIATKTVTKSALTLSLQDSINQPNNPFIDYAKFDGESLEDTCPTKTVDFFLTFLPGKEQRRQPLTITFLDHACVVDVIGLVLCKYILKGGKGDIPTDVRAYSLHIAEDDGEVDTDFPALDEKDAMSKFGFPNLALVEKNKVNKSGPPKTLVSVKILVPQNGYSVVKVERTDVKMKVILAKLIKTLKKNGRDFYLEKPGEEGKPVDMESTLEATGSFTFHLVHDDGSRRREENEIENKTSSAQAEIMSLQYKSYQVLLLHRLLASTEVSLGIHRQKIEIDPVSQPKSQRIFTRVKPVSLDVDNIGDCEKVEEKEEFTVFRIYYKKRDDFRNYEFQAPRKTADEILRKLHFILESRPQNVRSEFLQTKKNVNKRK